MSRLLTPPTSTDPTQQPPFGFPGSLHGLLYKQMILTPSRTHLLDGLAAQRRAKRPWMLRGSGHTLGAQVTPSRSLPSHARHR